MISQNGPTTGTNVIFCLVNQVKNEDVKKKNITTTKGKYANSKSNKNNSVVKSKDNSSNVKLEKKMN